MRPRSTPVRPTPSSPSSPSSKSRTVLQRRAGARLRIGNHGHPSVRSIEQLADPLAVRRELRQAARRSRTAARTGDRAGAGARTDRRAARRARARRARKPAATSRRARSGFAVCRGHRHRGAAELAELAREMAQRRLPPLGEHEEQILGARGRRARGHQRRSKVHGGDADQCQLIAKARAGMPSSPSPIRNTRPAVPSAEAIASMRSGGLMRRVSSSARALESHSSLARAADRRARPRRWRRRARRRRARSPRRSNT